MDARCPHSDHYSSRALAALDGRGVLRDNIQIVVIGSQLAMSRRPLMHGSALGKRAAIARLHLIALALLQPILLEPAQTADAKPDECGLASVYSTLSEETASGEDTSAKNLTAAHRSLPFGTMVQVDNQENGRSAVVRITDRGPFASGRIIDLSQIAAQKLGFSDLTQVCLKILALPEIGPVEEN